MLSKINRRCQTTIWYCLSHCLWASTSKSLSTLKLISISTRLTPWSARFNWTLPQLCFEISSSSSLSLRCSLTQETWNGIGRQSESKHSLTALPIHLLIRKSGLNLLGTGSNWCFGMWGSVKPRKGQHLSRYLRSKRPFSKRVSRMQSWKLRGLMLKASNTIWEQMKINWSHLVVRKRSVRSPQTLKSTTWKNSKSRRCRARETKYCGRY